MQIVYCVIAVLFGINVLIFGHELGHYLVGRYFKIAIPRFTVGFGPRILGVTIGETLFEWRLVPIWGFVQPLGFLGADDPNILALESEKHTLDEVIRRLGEREGFSDQKLIFLQRISELHSLLDPRRHYYLLNGWLQILFLAAGPAMNVALAFCFVGVSIAIEAQDPMFFYVHKYATRTALKNPEIAKNDDQFFLVQRVSSNQPITAAPSEDNVLLCLRYRSKEKTEKVPYDGSAALALSEARLFTLSQTSACKWDNLRMCLGVLEASAELPYTPKNKSGWPLQRLASEMIQKGFIRSMCWQFAVFSLGIAVFNLFPVPPLDGGKMVFSLLKAIGLPLPATAILRLSLVGVGVVGLYQLVTLVQLIKQWLIP